MNMDFIKINTQDVTLEENETLKNKCDRIKNAYGVNITTKDLATIHNRMVKRLEREDKKQTRITQNRLIARFTQKELTTLRNNYNKREVAYTCGEDTTAFEPVVKLFNPSGIGTWYICTLSPENIAFGICCLHECEIGYVSLDELNVLQLPFGLTIEKDKHFSANGQSVYQLFEALQTGVNASDKQHIALPNTRTKDHIEKKTASIVKNEIFFHQTDLVELCIEEDIIPSEYIKNSHYYFDHNGNKLGGEEAEKSKQEDAFHDLYYSEEKDIATWFLVTDWLAEKLEAKYETILVCSLGTWWGRTTFGQLIVDDTVIKEIAEECL